MSKPIQMCKFMSMFILSLSPTRLQDINKDRLHHENQIHLEILTSKEKDQKKKKRTNERTIFTKFAPGIISWICMYNFPDLRTESIKNPSL